MLKTLADLAKTVRSFLGIATFIILSLVALFLWLFSRGSFDIIISNFSILTREQFFFLVLSILVMLFIIIFILIVLSFLTTKPSPERNGSSYRISIVVHEEGDETSGIDDAYVTLSLSPEPQQKKTDMQGNVVFFFPSRLRRKKYKLNARKPGYEARKPKNITLENEAQFFLSLKPVKVTSIDTAEIKSVIEEPESEHRKDLILDGINFESYLRSIINEWEASYMAKIYVNVAGKDKYGQVHKPLDTLVDKIFSDTTNDISIALLGDFGTGKTTFLKHYTYRLAERVFREHSPLEHIPIFINLRNYELAGSIKQLLSNELNNRGVVADFNRINIAQLKKKVVLILDAFDEMSFSVERVSVQKNLHLINNLIKQVGLCIISCRTHFFRDKIEEKQLQGAQMVYMLPWTNPEITEYLQKAAGSNWENAFTMVKEIYNLEELAQTPLFLDMIADSFESFSHTQILSAELYKIYTNKWIERQIHKAVLDQDQKTTFMEELAWKMLTEGRAFIQWSELRNFIQERYDLFITLVDRFDNDIRTCSFLHRVTDNGGGYSFVHKSFLEFFVACHLAKQVQADHIKLLCMIELPNEIISFLSQLLDEPVYYERLHLWLEFKIEPEFALARRNSANILRAINKSPLSPEIEKYRSKIISESINVILSEQDADNLWRAIVTIGWLRSTDSVNILHNFITSEEISVKDPRVLRIALLEIGLLGDKSVTPILTKLLHAEPNFIVRQNSAVALGLLQDPAAIPALIKCLQNEKEAQIRRPIIWAIESTDPIAARIPLSTSALNDSSEEVRQYAALALGRIGDDKAIEVLDEVLKDKNPSVRRAAIESIGHIGGKRAYDIVLKTLNDPDPDVREASKYAINLLKQQ
ncbi:MAG: HEAT repeat domain-containing protein [Candidatus Heimdallarchaeota archaeon]|nr:HEAT repeat domain-containing protein [Candidatus Heimdallarchaeota archaeon]